MSWQNPADLNWSYGMLTFFVAMNTYTLGWASRLLLIGIFTIIVSAYYKATDDLVSGFAAGGVGTFLVALAGWVMTPSIVDWVSLAISIGVMFVAAAILLIHRNQGTA